MTLAQILETLNYHLRFPWSKGGMIRQWRALRQILLLWYETLIAEIRHADETGWRVNGVTHWLWCFTTETVTVYFVDRSRGSLAVRRMAKLLKKYRDELFTFLDHPEVPATNNHGEREVRFAVLFRKIINGTRSDQGALTQGVLMTVFRTLKRRGYNPIATLVAARREYVRTGHLPPFPPVITSEE